MSLETVKRVAADLLGIGGNRVRVKPSEVGKAAEALTREDVRGLIKDGVVYALPAKGVSRARGRQRHSQRKLGRRRGHGSRKGTRYSQVSRKEIWMSRVRAQRAFARKLVAEGKIERSAYRKLYLMIKGKAFRGKAQIETHLRESKLLKA